MSSLNYVITIQSIARVLDSKCRQKTATLRHVAVLCGIRVQCESKIPPAVFWNFFPTGWEFLINFLHTYYRTPFYVVSKLRYNDPKYSSCIGFEMLSKDSDFTSRGGTLWHPCTVWVKNPPTVFWNFFLTGWEFLLNFYTPIIRSFLH